MTVLNENLKLTGHYIVTEDNANRCRDQVIIASGAGVLLAGAVLGKITASGKYAPLAPGATDGSEVASAILYEGCDATSEDVRRTVTARDTSVHADVLVWADGVTDSQKSTAMSELSDVGIIGR